MAGNHAKLCPPSGWDRWSVCSASVDLQTGEGSSYADEGTAAHFLADNSLKAGLRAEDYIGQTIWVPDSQGFEEGEEVMFVEEGKEAPLTGSVWEVDHAMADPVQEYMDQVLIQEHDYLQFETKVPLEHITGEVDATGTCDALRVSGTTLASHDLKFGQGKKVYAKENGQQLLYLLGGKKDLDWMADFDKFEVHIHQPRLGHHDVWYLSLEELEMWAKRINRAAYPIVKQGLREYQPSVEGCRFCDYRKECDARTTMAMDSVQDFPEYELEEEDDAGTRMAEILDRVEFIEAWAKDMWTRANQMAKEKPGCIPGWDLFPGRGSREITNEKLLKSRLRKHGYKVDQYMPRKLKSPAQIEKEVGKAAYKEWVADLVEHKKGNPKLSRATEGRETARDQAVKNFPEAE